MSDNKFFRVSGVGSVQHTPETKKKWALIEGNKSDFAREAIINYASTFGFTYDAEKINSKVVAEAVEHLMKLVHEIIGNDDFGIKSKIVRRAIKKSPIP